MIYIDIEENRNMEVRERFTKNFIFKIKNILKIKSSKLKEEKIEDKTLIRLPNLENKTLNKLSRYIKQNCICIVCVSDNLLDNVIFMEYLKNENVKLLNGKWIFKILATKVCEYIVESKKEIIEYQEISILSNKINDVVVFTIRNLAEKVKIINVLTNDSYRFKKLEKEMYDKYGIILNINNNYKKSLLKSDIILNFDFSESEFNKYTLPKKSSIINFNENINVQTKSFEGINASFVEISMPKNYLKYLLYFKHFNTTNLYESFIYKNKIGRAHV